MRCPLGYNLDEGICPRAPCMECMRRLGEDIVADLQGLHETNSAPLVDALEKAETKMAHCYLNSEQRRKFMEWVPPAQWTLKTILETLADRKLQTEKLQEMAGKV
jgi:hypothetical protein